MAKAGLSALLTILADEWEHIEQLRVNGVVPGPMHSPLRLQTHPGDDNARLAAAGGICAFVPVSARRPAQVRERSRHRRAGVAATPVTSAAGTASRRARLTRRDATQSQLHAQAAEFLGRQHVRQDGDGARPARGRNANHQRGQPCGNERVVQHCMPSTRPPLVSTRVTVRSGRRMTATIAMRALRSAHVRSSSVP